jgi:uncharacterized phage-associated protein
MASVHAVADYILRKVVTEEGASIHSRKLQRIACFCQARNIALHREPLFDEGIDERACGPIVWSLHARFMDYGDFAIDIPDGKTDCLTGLSDRDRTVIDEVWGACGSMSDSQLRNLNHCEALLRA